MTSREIRGGDRRRFSPRSLVGLLALSWALGCSTQVQRLDFASEVYSWPESRPRVRLVSVFADGGSDEGWRSRNLFGDGERRSPTFVRPYGVAWDDEDLLITDPGASRVVRLTADRKVHHSKEGLFSGPIGVATCADGVVVTDARNGRIALLDRELRLVRWLAESLQRPSGVVCYQGSVFVAETGRHRLLKLEGRDVRVVAGGRGTDVGTFNFPAALAAGPESLWVGDTLNFRIQRWQKDRDEGAWSSFGQLGDTLGSTPRIKGIAIDANGNVWVSDAVLDQVAIFSEDGRLLISLGRRGFRPGEFSFPAGIAVHPDGRVAVVDSLNRRVQIFASVSARGGPAPADG